MDTSEKTEPAPQATTPAAPAAVVVGKKKKKKKKKYSKNLKHPQQSAEALDKAAYRVSRAVERGLNQYRKQRSKSARKRRDGLLRDAPRNLAKGFGKTLELSNRVPFHVVRVFDTKQARKAVRRATKRIRKIRLGW